MRNEKEKKTLRISLEISLEKNHHYTHTHTHKINEIKIYSTNTSGFKIYFPIKYNEKKNIQKNS